MILIYYHDSFWYAPDEGVFSYFADLVNQGKIYGVDFHGVQPGYHTFWNAFLFDVFGRDLVVLRYPLILLSALQAIMVTYMLRRKGALLSLSAGLWITCFGFLQFLNPSANWYAFYLAFFCIFVLTEFPRSALRLLITGSFIGICLGLRHPSGIFLGAGVLSYLLFENASVQKYKFKKTYLAQLLLIIVFIGLLTYVWKVNFELSGLLYIGIWPILFVLFMLYKRPVHNTNTIKVLLPCALGVLISLAPLLLYQMIYGDLFIWAKTSIFYSSRILDRDFFDVQQYYGIVFDSMSLLIANPGVITFANAIYWICLYCIIPLTSILVFYHIVIIKDSSKITPVMIIPLFSGYVSLYYQIPIYLFFSLGLYGVCLFTLTPAKYQNIIVAFAIFLSFFSMSQYIARSLEHSGTGKRVPSQIEGASLKISKQSRDQYNNLLKYIDDYTVRDDYIFAFPVNPEIYFLSQRQNPTPYISTAVSVSSDQEYDNLMEILEKTQPRLIINRPEDKYMGFYEEKLVSELTSKLKYKQVASIGHFIIYIKE